jgi:Cd2+/Zn2+-exporting ATPase
MTEKLKVSNPDILSTLDNIGCNCGSDSCSTPPLKAVEEAKVHRHSHDHDHDHDHGVDDVLEGHVTPTASLVRIITSNGQLLAAFVLFFVALFTKFHDYVDLGVFLVAYALIARDVLKSAVKSVVKGRMLDENFLMAIASIVAFAIGEYAEAVAVMLFYRVGGITEDYALTRSKHSISELLNLKPDFANLKTLSGTKKVDPNSVQVGDIIVVKPGEKIPLDGLVQSGHSIIDAAMLTGESLPVDVKEGSEVYSGTINMNGVIEVLVSKPFSESTVSKILSMVQKANDNKAVTEKFITKFAKVYTPMVVVGATLLAVIPPLFFGGSFETWLYRGAIFLVVSCPCALVISVPLGYFGGIGGAARRGILVKGGHFLDSLKNASTIVFDKTGTLTKGNFKLESIETFENTSEEEIKRLSAHLESLSNHPIAKAVVEAYDGTIDENLVSEVKEVPGKGLLGRVDGDMLAIGNDALMKDQEVAVPTSDSIGTILYLSKNKVLIGVLSINDEIKDKTIEGLQALRKLGVKKFVMLTGDRKNIAEAVGKKLDIDEVYSELLPGDKLEKLESLLKDNEKVVFVGDGINDAPVITRADVGIAMGNLGSDVAIESSDIVLMKDEITTVADGVKVARFTSNIIWQNIILALTLKGVIMILGAIGLAELWVAVIGDVGVAFVAILNSSRAIYAK